MPTSLRSIAATLTRLLLPTRCASCDMLGGEVICADCSALLQRVEPYCLRCGRLRRTSFASPDCGECHGQSIGIQRARSSLVYNEAGRDLLATFKFRGSLGAGAELCEHAFSVLPETAAEHYGEPELSFEAIVPVPLHPARMRQRKFNQSQIIADRLAARLGIPCRPTLLRRSRDTPTQVGLSQSQRRENVRGAFECGEPLGALKGRAVLVVDDLMTTGATLHACASALRRSGCTAAFGFTLFSTHHDYEADGAPL
jgi:ComF family protein